MFKGKFVRTKNAIKQMAYRAKYTVLRPAYPVNPEGRVYVNIGCGVNTGPEFINVDAVPQAKTHVISDARRLPMFKDNSVDLIYASHVIEHFPRGQIKTALKEWLRMLKPGGVLRFGVPNFDELIRMYQKSGNDIDSIVNQLMGQDGEWDDHHSIWNKEYAEKILKEVGYAEVRTWDVLTADHHTFTDKTNRVYEVNGEQIPFSLNLEAVKGSK
jgi:predicted SAM-dependent methyltransferase